MIRVLAVCAALLLVGPAFGAEDADPVDTLKAVTKWMTERHYPNAAGRRFVRVKQGGRTDQEGVFRHYESYGFVLEEDEKSLRILTPQLGEARVNRTAPDAAREDRVIVEDTDLAEFAKTQEANDEGLGWGPHLGPTARLTLLAWLCQVHGHPQTARKLIEWAQERAREGKLPLLEAFAADMAHIDMWRNVLAHGDLSQSDAQLLVRWQTYVQRHAQSKRVDRAKEAVALLSQRRDPPLGETESQARIRTLIDALTTQRGLQNGQPGRCDIFEDARGDQSPAQQLLDMGYEAVPALIAALDDRRFTRSVGYVRDFYFSHHVLRVGDCALDIVQHISAKWFWDPPYFSEHLSQQPAEKRKSAHEAVEVWWKEASKVGEQSMLERDVRAGGRAGAFLAGRLAKKYPDVALDAIRAGIAKATDDGPRTQLVGVLGTMESEKARAALRELLNDSTPSVRIVAARALLEREPKVATEAVIDAWMTSTTEPGMWSSNGATALEFLVGCGRVDAIEALEARWPKLGVYARVQVIQKLVWGGWSSPYVLVAPKNGKFGKGSQLAPEAVRHAAEDLLARKLGEEALYALSPGSYSSFMDGFRRPQVGDIAAWALARLLPDVYAFQAKAPTAQRLRSRRLIENQWRQRRGMRPLPEITVPKPPRADEKVVGPLLDAYAEASDEDAQALTQKILAVGPGALPHVRQRIEHDLDDKRFAALARKLALLISKVRVENTDVPAWKEMDARLQALQGTAFSADAIIECILVAARDMPEGVGRFQIAFEREVAWQGVSVVATLSAKPANRSTGTSSTGDSIHYAYSVTISHTRVGSSSGVGAADHMRKRESWSDEIKALQKVVSADPDVFVEGTVLVGR